MEMRNNKSFFKVVIVILLLLSGCSGDSQSSEEENISENNNTEDTTETVITENEKDIKIYALFGVDSRNNAYGIGTRSDSIMLISVNTTDKKIKVASILRDTLVHIEGRGYEKITHAHSYGGPDLALSTINENFDLNVEDYLTFNFVSFEELIDMIGGVEIDIEEDDISRLSEYNGTYSGYITSPGTYTLDGEQALSYSRNRSTEGGDIKRSLRQRNVLFSVFNKVKILATEDKISIATKMLDTVSTNLNRDEALSLLNDISSYEIEDMASFPQIFYSGLIHYDYGDRFVEIPYYLSDMCIELHNYLEIGEDYETSETVDEYSAEIAEYAEGPNSDTSNSYGNETDETEVEVNEPVENIPEEAGESGDIVNE